MRDRLVHRSIALFLTLALLPAAASAQPGSKPAPAPAPKALGTFDAWTAIELPDRGGKVCYMVARPAKSEPANVRRGEILLVVTHRPAEKRRDEVTFQSGYPYKDGAPVIVEVEKRRFELFTRPDVDPEAAWTRDGAADKALVEAMRPAMTLTVKGISARGTETVDTFSLSGFGKAYAEIGKACGIR